MHDHLIKRLNHNKTWYDYAITPTIIKFQDSVLKYRKEKELLKQKLGFEFSF